MFIGVSYVYELGEPRRSVLKVDYSPEVNRGSIAFRFLLVIPYLLVYLALLLFVFLVSPLVWIIALGLGRLPRFGVDLYAYLIGYHARLLTYLYFVSNTHPPIVGSGIGSKVEVEFFPSRLPRLSILFRLILAIPALFIGQISMSGLPLVGFFEWLVILVRGDLPKSVFDANLAVIRFSIRTEAWLLMLSGVYPDGLFGDKFNYEHHDSADPNELVGSYEGFSAESPSGQGEVYLNRLSKAIVVICLISGLAMSFGRGQSTNSIVTQTQNSKGVSLSP